MAQVVRTFYNEEKAEPPGRERHEMRVALNKDLRERQSTPAQKVERAINSTRGFLSGSLTKVRAAVEPAIGKAQKFAREHPSNAPGAHDRMTGMGGMGGGMDFGFQPDFGMFGATKPTANPTDDFKRGRKKRKARGLQKHEDYMDYINRF